MPFARRRSSSSPSARASAPRSRCWSNAANLRRRFPKLKIDLHSHTRMSDGTLSPQELSDFMGERGVELFSISDHDTLAAYGMFDPPPGARVITSIEINTTWRENEVHVLGYGVPLGPSPINELLEYNQAQRRLRAETMVDRLRQAGYPIT